MDKSAQEKSFLLLALAVFAAGVIAKLSIPLLEWDGFFLEAAKSWAQGEGHHWVFDYPPLYPCYLVLPFRFFGAFPETARLFNTLPVLATAWLVYATAKNLSDRRAGVAAALLYLISPVTIQGVQSLAGSDSSLLPLCFICVFWIFSKPVGEVRGRAILLACIVELSFWAKITSSIALIAGCSLSLLFFRGRIEKAFSITTTLGVSGGAILFILTWSTISLSFWGSESWADVFLATAHYFPMAAQFHAGELIFKWAIELARVVFWFSPFLIYLSFSAIRDIFQSGKFARPSRFLAFLCVFYFIGHIFIGGSDYGFPRYHAAISPLLYIFAGISLAGLLGRITASQHWILIIPAFLLPVLGVIYFDPELLINLRFKQLILFGDYQGAFLRVFAPLFAYAALPFAAGAVYNRMFGLKSLKTAFIAAASAALLGSCVALSVKQSLAAYSTSYQYGAIGKTAVLELVSGKLSGGETVMATPEFLYALRQHSVSGPGWNTWQSEREMSRFISEREPAFIIAGWTTHTRAQLDYLLKDGVMRDLLGKKYVLLKIGTYFVWEKRRGRPAVVEFKAGTEI